MKSVKILIGLLIASLFFCCKSVFANDEVVASDKYSGKTIIRYEALRVDDNVILRGQFANSEGRVIFYMACSPKERICISGIAGTDISKGAASVHETILEGVMKWPRSVLNPFGGLAIARAYTEEMIQLMPKGYSPESVKNQFPSQDIYVKEVEKANNMLPTNFGIDLFYTIVVLYIKDDELVAKMSDVTAYHREIVKKIFEDGADAGIVVPIAPKAEDNSTTLVLYALREPSFGNRWLGGILGGGKRHDPKITYRKIHDTCLSLLEEFSSDEVKSDLKFFQSTITIDSAIETTMKTDTIREGIVKAKKKAYESGIKFGYSLNKKPMTYYLSDAVSSKYISKISRSEADLKCGPNNFQCQDKIENRLFSGLSERLSKVYYEANPVKKLSDTCVLMSEKLKIDGKLIINTTESVCE